MKLREIVLAENSAYNQEKEESGTCNEFGLNMKGKREEDNSGRGDQGLTNKSKYKKLEMPIFVGENPKFEAYRVNFFFYISDLTKTKKVKFVVVSFA